MPKDNIIQLVGVDGCGKDTVLERLIELFTEKIGRPAFKLREFELEHKRFPTQEELADIGVLVVAEPTYSPPTGTAIRQGMLPTDKPPISAEEEGRLYSEDRGRLYQDLVLPFLAQPGRWVIQNRGVICSLVFQSLRWPNGDTQEAMERLTKMSGNRLELEHPPQHMLILDLDPTIGFKRMQDRTDLDRLERDLALQERVRARYLDPELQNLFLSQGTDIHIIDAGGAKADVSATMTDLFPKFNVC
ncbi:thymidylate kinase [Patescibacteria group bacterium]|nr:thymidylate kinase [Patescibacteria group bacterium]